MKNNKIFFIILILCFLLQHTLYAQPHRIANFNPNKTWADSVVKTLTLDEKIAQLMIVRAFSNKDSIYNRSLIDSVKKYQVGGVCFFQGGIVRQALITNELQKVSKIPMMVSIDAEYGLAMRLDSVMLFPRQMALGATYDTATIYRMGKEIARQCKRMGIHVNYASCIDVNCNSRNPVINSRSFGANPQLVADCGIAYMKGMQENGVMPTAKHFPGHGDTDADSHFSLPTIKHNRQRLDSIELYPFIKAIQAGIDGVMVGHLNVPTLDTSVRSISSTSKPIITDLLIDSMNFNGIIITDGLEMKGIAKYYAPGDMEVMTLLAGNDLLLLPTSAYIVIQKIKEAIDKGILTEEDIDRKCLKMLKAKEKYVLSNCNEIDVRHLYEDINTQETEDIINVLTRKSLTLLKNDDHIIPFQNIPAQPLLHLRIDNGGMATLETTLSNYLPMKTVRITQNDLKKNSVEMQNIADSGQILLVSLHTTTQYPISNYGLTQEVISFLDNLSKRNKIIFVVMGNPYVLNYLPFSRNFSVVLVAYHPVHAAEKAVGEALCGLFPITGKLPIDLNNYVYGTGVCSKEQNIAKVNFSGIDSLAQLGISENAYPGCRILIAHKGEVIYNKSFGKHTYEGDRQVSINDVYDLASITKAAATTLAIMKLVEEDKIDIHDKLSDYLPYLNKTDKEDITIAEVLTHTSGLSAWIPFYKKTFSIIDSSWNPDVYSKTLDATYSVKVCKDMYMNNQYIDSVYYYLVTAPLKDNKHYEYSDIGFYFLADLIHKVTNTTLDTYVNDNFYQPMGLKHILFNPSDKILSHYLVPTERDMVFRKQLVQGYVHDEGAAMLRGVSGHAGLFATADDLYVVLQMLLNKGEYNGIHYLQPHTIKKFTSYYSSKTRRGLGFDKPLHGNKKGPHCGVYVSSQSYGHSGFTGTFFWVDPKYDLIYIFLSNRIYPNADNKKLAQLNIRTNIQDLIYQYVEIIEEE